MQFADSEIQALLRTTARSYLAETFPRERLFALERGAEQMTEDDLFGMKDLGWFNLLGAASDGASLLDTAVVIEELGYAGVPSPVAPINIAQWVLSDAERLAATQRCTLSDGTLLRAGKSSLEVSNGSATGALPLVPFAELSEDVLAPATIAGEAALAVISLVRVRVEPLALIDRRCYSSVHCDGAPAAVVATGAQASALCEQLDALMTAFSVVELAGMMRRVLDMTTEHISTRMQFGQPIAKFQAARHRAAEMLTQVETTRWAAYHALWQFDLDGSTDEIWLTKHWAVRAAARVYEISHLLHGGVGVGMEHPLHLYTQGIAAFAVRGGTMDELVTRTLASIERGRPAEVQS